MRTPSLFLTLLLAGCGCGETDVRGDGDTDAGEDVRDVLVPDGPCGPCDDGDDCTMDLCNSETLECVFLPLDADLDGFGPPECGGRDCDDTRADVHPGAPEVCLDGVDQDCDGVVDGPIAMMEDLQVTSGDGDTDRPALAWTGSAFAIAWSFQPSHTGTDLGLSLLDGDGERIGGDVLVRTASEGGNHFPSIAWTGASLVVVWDVGDALGFARLGPTGEVEVATRRFGTTGRPQIAWTGSEIGLAWTEDSWLPDPSLEYLALSVDGDITSDPAGIPLTIAAMESRPFGDQAMAWTGSEIVLVWENWEERLLDIYLARVGTGGDLVADPIRITDTGAWSSPRLAWTGSAIGMIYTIPIPSVYFSRMTPTGTLVGRDTRLMDFSFDSSSPDVVWTGSEFAAAWIVGPEGDQENAVTLIEPGGAVRYEPVYFSSERGLREQLRIVWTGSEIGAAWVGSACEGDPPEGCHDQVMFTRVGLCD